MKFVYLFLLIFVFLTRDSVTERQDGENIIGSIIPIHKSGNLSKTSCGPLNEHGVAMAEAMRFAVKTVNSKYALLGSDASMRTLGFDLRDSCDKIELAKDIAYSFNAADRTYRKTKGGMKPVSAVLSRFNRDDIPVMKLLGFEKLTQLSYASDNVKLFPDLLKNRADAKFLLSTHPDDYYKLKAVVRIIKALGIEYVQLVSMNTLRSRESLSLIKTEFHSDINRCLSDVLLVESKQSVRYVVSQLGRNRLANVVILNLDHQASLWVFEEAKIQNLTRKIWFSVISWKNKMTDLTPYAEQVEGMVFVANKEQDATGFHLYLSNLNRPYNESMTMKQLFIQTGGSKECLQDTTTNTSILECDRVHKKMIGRLLEYKSDAAYVIDAVYAFAHAVSKITENKSIPMIDAIKSVKFTSPLTRNIIQFNSRGIVDDVISVIYNIQKSSTKKPYPFEIVQSGTWNERASIKLSLNKRILRWKQGSVQIPISKCSIDCLQGHQRVIPGFGPKCCWTCERCHENSVSERNNSQSCKKCASIEVANPQQTSCVKFKTTSFRWFDPLGEFMIFLITAGLCIILFTLGIFSQNRECDVVRSADYKMMVVMLLGLMLCFFAPVPLLLPPSTASCISYVIMFNYGLTIPLAIFFTKSAAVRHHFFDENMELKNSCLGSKPHLIVLVAVLIMQAVILTIGIRLTSSYIDYYPTAQWNVKYAECSYVRNTVFWVGFAYNVILSIALTFLSCRSVKMDEDFKELKWICITTCCYYFMSLLFIAIIYSVYGANVVEAASVLIILFGFMFLLTYFAPKLRLILFHQPKKVELGPDGNPLIQKEEEQPQVNLTSHMSGVSAFKHQKVLAVKVRDK